MSNLQLSLDLNTITAEIRSHKQIAGQPWKTRGRWSYYINKARFDRWMAGQDIIQADQLEAISEAVLSKVSDYLDRFEQARGEISHGEQNQGAW